MAQARRDEALARRAVLPRSTAVSGPSRTCHLHRFADEEKNIFPDSVARYDRMLNSSAPGANSMYNYFKEVSYNQLEVPSTFYPASSDSVLSYVDSHPRNFYRPYNAATNPIGYAVYSEARAREQAMFRAAVNAMAPQIPTELNIDGNRDGIVDNVCFIISGNVDGWADLSLAAHGLPQPELHLSSWKARQGYNMQVREDLLLPQYGVYSLAHEQFHSMGAPDLYHYSFDGLTPVARWDLMEAPPNPPYTSART